MCAIDRKSIVWYVFMHTHAVCWHTWALSVKYVSISHKKIKWNARKCLKSGPPSPWYGYVLMKAFIIQLNLKVPNSVVSRIAHRTFAICERNILDTFFDIVSIFYAHVHSLGCSRFVRSVFFISFAWNCTLL